MEPEAAATLDSGSFRDRDARVFYRDGRVLRGLSPDADPEWAELQGRELFARLHGDGRLVGTREVSAEAAALPGDWARVLEHERIPFVFYALTRPSRNQRGCVRPQTPDLRLQVKPSLLLLWSAALRCFSWSLKPGA